VLSETSSNCSYWRRSKCPHTIYNAERKGKTTVHRSTVTVVAASIIHSVRCSKCCGLYGIHPVLQHTQQEKKRNLVEKNHVTGGGEFHRSLASNSPSWKLLIQNCSGAPTCWKMKEIVHGLKSCGR